MRSTNGSEVTFNDRIWKFAFWKDDDFYIGYLNDHPDHESQGESKEELAENLKSLLEDIVSEERLWAN